MTKTSHNIALFTGNTSQQNKLLNLQNQVLEDVVKGKMARQELLDSLCLCAEALVPESLCSIMLLQDDDSLSVKSAPNASQGVIDDLSGLLPSSISGYKSSQSPVISLPGYFSVQPFQAQKEMDSRKGAKGAKKKL